MKGVNEKSSDIKRNNFGSKIYASYRDSKLTEILSKWRGRNLKTYIISNVSSFAANCEEIYSTLQFVRRAMVIRTLAKKNEKVKTKKFNKDQENNSNNNLGFNSNNQNNKKILQEINRGLSSYC